MSRTAAYPPRSREVAKRWEQLSSGAQAVLTAFALHPRPMLAEWLVRIAREAAAVDELAAGRWIVEGDDGSWSLNGESLRAPLAKLAPWSLRQAQIAHWPGFVSRNPDTRGDGKRVGF